MECRDVREMADSFVGDELLTETNHEILRHLQTCPACRADVAARRSLRAALRRAFHDRPDLDPTPEFVAQLRTTLEQAALTAGPRRAFRVPRWWALAAMVLLAVGLGATYRGREWLAATAALARAAVGDHRNCALEFRLAEHPIRLAEAAQRYGGIYGVLESLPAVDVTTVAGAAHVLERHACVYEGRRFAHVVLSYRGARVSLLVTSSVGGLPLTLPGAARVGRHEERIDSLSVVSLRTARYAIFVVGDLGQADLAQLADAIAEPLSRQLTTL